MEIPLSGELISLEEIAAEKGVLLDALKEDDCRQACEKSKEAEESTEIMCSLKTT